MNNININNEYTVLCVHIYVDLTSDAGMNMKSFMVPQPPMTPLHKPVRDPELTHSQPVFTLLSCDLD